MTLEAAAADRENHPYDNGYWCAHDMLESGVSIARARREIRGDFGQFADGFKQRLLEAQLESNDARH